MEVGSGGGVMYVKLYSQILDSSIADNRKLRHFFTDLLLCSDRDGNVLMTDEAIARRTRAPIEEVRWGLQELQKPEARSLTPAHEGRRIIPLEGHGYGWKIVNYETYRDYKSAAQMRADTAERVRRFRQRRARNGKLSPADRETAVREARAERVERLEEMEAERKQSLLEPGELEAAKKALEKEAAVVTTPQPPVKVVPVQVQKAAVKVGLGPMFPG